MNSLKQVMNANTVICKVIHTLMRQADTAAIAYFKNARQPIPADEKLKLAEQSTSQAMNIIAKFAKENPEAVHYLSLQLEKSATLLNVLRALTEIAENQPDLFQALVSEAESRLQAPH